MPEARALGADLAAMHLDELFCQGEPDAEPVAFHIRHEYLSERLENRFKEVRLDADAGIRDAYLCRPAFFRKLHRDGASRGRVFRSIRKEVRDRLLDADRISFGDDRR